ISPDSATHTMTCSYRPGLPHFDFSVIKNFHINNTAPVADITNETGLSYLHNENHVVEFDREALLPHMLSTEGPAVAVADINGDGLDDIYIGSPRNQQGVVYIQQPAGKFLKTNQPALDADSS